MRSDRREDAERGEAFKECPRRAFSEGLQAHLFSSRGVALGQGTDDRR